MWRGGSNVKMEAEMEPCSHSAGTPGTVRQPPVAEKQAMKDYSLEFSEGARTLQTLCRDFQAPELGEN